MIHTKVTLTQNNKITQAVYDISLLKYTVMTFINNNKIPATVMKGKPQGHNYFLIGTK